MTSLHAGTVTFAFTDIEGSTRLLQELGDEGYGVVSRDHRRIVRDAFGTAGGTEIDTQGDAFFFSFPRARDAVAAAVAAQRALRDHAWPDGREVRVRMGLHTGEPHVGEEGYLGIDVVRAARIASAGAGGQILISETTRALLGNTLPEGVAVVDLGEQKLKDIQHERIYEVAVDGRATGYKPAAKTKTRSDAMAERFEERVQDYVERQLEQAFAGVADGRPPEVPTKLALGGLGIAGAALLMLAIVVVAVLLLVKVAFAGTPLGTFAGCPTGTLPVPASYQAPVRSAMQRFLRVEWPKMVNDPQNIPGARVRMMLRVDHWLPSGWIKSECGPRVWHRSVMASVYFPWLDKPHNPVGHCNACSHIEFLLSRTAAGWTVWGDD